MIDRFEAALARVREIRSSLRDEAPSLPLLEDLLASAQRRQDMGRYDDAVARLYRFMEGLAQCTLWERFQLRTGARPVEPLPQDSSWDGARSRAVEGCVQLGLKDAYRLLEARGDLLGAVAQRLGERGDLEPCCARAVRVCWPMGPSPSARTPVRSFLRNAWGSPGSLAISSSDFPTLNLDQVRPGTGTATTSRPSMPSKSPGVQV